MVCNFCGSKSAIKVVVKYRHIKDPIGKEKILVKEEHCNLCMSMPNSPFHLKDALGNRVFGRKNDSAFYSYATGKYHKNNVDFADHLRNNGLVQKDGPLKDIRNENKVVKEYGS